MLNTLSVQFPQIENQETEGTHEEHDHKESVCCTCHYVEGKGEKNRHKVYFEFVDFLQPTFDNGIFFSRLACLDYSSVKSFEGLVALWGLSLPFLPLRIPFLWSGSVFVDVNEILDKSDDDEDGEYEGGKEPQEEITSQYVLELPHLVMNIVSLISIKFFEL